MIQMDGGDRLRVTLLDRMSMMENSQSSLTGLTLEDILMADKSGTSPPLRNQSNRTLLDVMQREHRHDHGRDKTTWKTLREKLRLKRNPTVWISSIPIPTLNTPIPTRDSESHRLGSFLSEQHSTAEGRLRLGAALAEEREEEMPTETTEVQPARMSLMELLEENEGQMSVDGEEEERVDGGVATAEEISCCVCMVRSKGAAFIPCGHTFCRLCSRELWVQRGNCPLCNTSIVEILDLF